MPSRSKSSAPQITREELNRATLARQHLLGRTAASPLEVVERLVGLQSQLPGPPYTGLWSRIEGFAFVDLAEAIAGKQLVRMGLMRGTIHVVSARDAAGLWTFMAPFYAGNFASVRGPALEASGVELAAAVEQAETLLREAPRTPKDLGEAMAGRWPDANASWLGSIPRYLSGAVQIPPRGLWGESATATYALLSDWVGREDSGFEAREVVRRYLAGFGPASVADAQQWCGRKGLKAAFDELGDELVMFVGPDGETKLYDLADAERPAADTPAPVRLLPEWDNVLLSYADRTRVIDEDRRKAIMSVNGINDAAVLVDGRVEATWKASPGKAGGTIAVAPFGKLTKALRGAIESEAHALLTAMGAGYADGDVSIEPAGAAWAPSWKRGHKRSGAGG